MKSLIYSEANAHPNIIGDLRVIQDKIGIRKKGSNEIDFGRFKSYGKYVFLDKHIKEKVIKQINEFLANYEANQQKLAQKFADSYAVNVKCVLVFPDSVNQNSLVFDKSIIVKSMPTVQFVYELRVCVDEDLCKQESLRRYFPVLYNITYDISNPIAEHADDTIIQVITSVLNF